ncbi:MAG: response regulator [Desulfuromonadales bacterium]
MSMMLDHEQLTRLTEMFLAEAQDHLSSFNECLIKIEQSADCALSAESVTTIYRCAHSLKGGARIVDLSLVELVCQSLEDCLLILQQKTAKPDRSVLDLLHDSVDLIERLLSSPSPQTPSTSLKSESVKICKRFDEALKMLNLSATPGAGNSSNESCNTMIESNEIICDTFSDPGNMTAVPIQAELSERQQLVEQRPGTTSETVRVPIAGIDKLLAGAEELIALKMIFRQQARDLKEVIGSIDILRRNLAKQQHNDRATMLELERSLGTLMKRVIHINRINEQDGRQSENLIEGLILDTKRLLMLPASSLTQGFHKLVRDVARTVGKMVELTISGDGIELDRRILQELKDPLVHLLRNSIDHGIEVPAVRQAAGKVVTARIRIDIAAIENSKIEITISDDGSGIDTARIREVALRNGLLSPESLSDMPEKDLQMLIFNSGFSTRSEVSLLSGRGLGLAIVTKCLDKLGGSISVDSTFGAGTTFKLIVPVSLATIRGIHVRTGNKVFAVPTVHVRKVCRVRTAEIKAVGTKDSIVVDNQTVQLVSLAALLGIPATAPDSGGYTFALILGQGDTLFAFQIDEVVCEEDLLVKGIGPLLRKVRNIAGATILANGAIVPILNVMDLMCNSESTFTHHFQAISGVSASHEESTKKRLLVVDDSITSRTLIMNVLESYGYEVKTAVDGLDALATLQGNERFDLATVDVQMPHMDGFELTARIRADERLSRLPVVLITSLDSVEDKKKGINSGADAYIVKSSFDQTSLLDIIRKLI